MKGIILLLLLATMAMAFERKPMWTRQDRANPRDIVELRFALKQQNLAQLTSTLLDVSNPYSANYGKWWEPEQILDLVSPPQEVSDAVTQFVKHNGARYAKNGRDYVSTRFTVQKAEEFFGIELHNFQHVTKNVRIIRAVSDYVIPAEIKDSVDFVSGLLEFPTLRKQAHQPAVDISDSVGADPGYVIPQTIQAAYAIPTDFATNANSSICLAEFQNDASYNKKDLVTFATQTATKPITVTHIVGPFSGADPDLESTLDVQYGGAIALGNDVWFWTVGGWMWEFVSEIAATKKSPLVVSMSWGWPEPNQCDIATCKGETSEDYVNRVNVEFQKMGLRGITVLAASGDQGAPGDGDPYCGDASAPLSTIFPGASPWVLSVGATMLANTSKLAAAKAGAEPPVCKNFQCANSTAEVACSYPEALITSGGGFSNYSPQPAFQADAVEAYLKSAKLPPAAYFNASNRGFPDVSALGHNYLICATGSFEQVDGTSCSSPVFGAVIALLNGWRLNNNKSPLGYAVPLMYAAAKADPTTFIDITEGDNKCTESCCSQYGYETAVGWDPVTGLGSPNFPSMLKFVQSLP